MAEMLRIHDALSYLNLKPSVQAAEFGCGIGFFALALARRLPQGTVHAIDIQKHRIERLRSDARRLGIYNVKAVHRDVEQDNGSGLPAESLDLVVIPNCLFQSENHYGIMKEAERTLRKDGQLLLIDWLNPHSLSLSIQRIPVAQVKEAAGQLSFSLEHEFRAGDYHFGLVFEKS